LGIIIGTSICRLQLMSLDSDAEYDIEKTDCWRVIGCIAYIDWLAIETASLKRVVIAAASNQ